MTATPTTNTATKHELSDPDVVTKYQTASTCLNAALVATAATALPGTSTHTICLTGDTALASRLATVYKKATKGGKEGKGVGKGMAFPTCVSVNECACHYCPVSGEGAVVLQPGDLVKM